MDALTGLLAPDALGKNVVKDALTLTIKVISHGLALKVTHGHNF